MDLSSKQGITLGRLFAVLASGLALVLISPPVGLHFLHWIVFLPLFWALRPGDNKGNAILGYLAGFVAVHSLFFWLTESVVRFSNIPPWLAVQLVVLFAFGFGAPYAIVFGATKQWAKAFEGLALPQPDWYVASHAFTTLALVNAMGAFSDRSVSTLSSTPGGSGSSGFGGGGFSGGGGGGGGGGSW